MAKGIAKVEYVGSAGQVMPQGAGVTNWDFLYETSSVESTKFNVGDRVVLPDGRAFRYCKEHTSTGTGPALIEPSRGVKFLFDIKGTASGTADGYSGNVDRVQAVGDTELHYATQTFAKDVLRGGYAHMTTAGNTHQEFGIIGNSACNASAMTVYLDRPISVVCTSTQFTYLMPNPYRFIGRDTDSYNSCAGVSISSPAAGDYFWIQTWGLLWINQGPDGVGGAAGERRVIFNVDGSLRTGETGNDNSQTAGFIVDMTGLGVDAKTFVMLQISP